MSETSYTVKGMTCDHCAMSVREEVEKVDGITGIDVEVATGKLTIRADAPPHDGAVREAVAEAGYEVVG